MDFEAQDNFATLIGMREDVANLLGECGATDAVSRAVLNKMRAKWIKSKPRKQKSKLSFLYEQAFMQTIKDVNLENTCDAYNGKIAAIKYLRNRPEWIEAGRDTFLMLKEAKEYVEWLCYGGHQFDWMKV